MFAVTIIVSYLIEYDHPRLDVLALFRFLVLDSFPFDFEGKFKSCFQSNNIIVIRSNASTSISYMHRSIPITRRLSYVSTRPKKFLDTKESFSRSLTSLFNGPLFAMTHGSSGSSAPSRGAFIVFEGADRAGKTTQCTRLVEALSRKGVDVELWKFPDRTTAIGKMINSYLTSETNIDDAAIHLLFSANRWEKREQLLRKIRAGTTIVADRYAFSGVAFTAAKGVKGLDREWCKSPDAGLPAPDVVFFLNISPEAAATRGGFGGERYERPAFQTSVLKHFDTLKGPSWRDIDAGRRVEEIEKDILQEAASVVRACKRGAEIKTLWDA